VPSLTIDLRQRRANGPRLSPHEIFMSLDIALTQLRTPTGPLLQHVTLQVPPGVIHTVMGASGSGKSSLLAAVCGTLPEQLSFDGAITLNGIRIDTLPTERRQVGILFQEDLLFAHMTVFENLLFALPAGPKAQRFAAVTQGLEDLEMAAFAQADPATLSGGQRGRVALMRALLAQPQALLLDEPFSKLDAALRERMRDFVFQTVRKRSIPVLMVTHDVSDIADPKHLTQL
jgi:putative thiamine transport system ATP-binding protein